jgi:nicotinamide-nucleotide amidase
MRAAILAVGSELLGTERMDTNSLRLTEALESHGVELVEKRVVGDDDARIAAAVVDLLGRVDLLLLTGGLGPTADDRTREAVAAALGRDLVRDPEIVDAIRRRFAEMEREMPAVNARQGDVLAGARVLANRRGTAPGQLVEESGKTLFLFPGVPAELLGLLESELRPWLAARSTTVPVHRRVLRVACLPESEVEELIAPLYERWGREGIGLLPSPGDIELRLSVPGDRPERLEAMESLARECLGEAVYGDGRASLEEEVGRLLGARGLTVGTAESCTGGLLAERITRVAGSSAWFLGSIVAYADGIKERQLGVPGELLREHGAVSREVALAMARGCRERLGCDWALSVTGIAGPGGGSETKPVGTVHLAASGPEGRERPLLCRFPGGRRMVRRLSSQWALDLLRREIL